MKLTNTTLALMLASAGLLTLPTHAQVAPAALPTGGVVSAGSAAIAQNGAAMQVNQSSNKAVIDWQTFNIGRDASVRFNQPSTSAITLNRAAANTGRSVIDGALSANGQVWLLNPDGVMFSNTARVDAGGLLATTMNLGNADFIGGNYRFIKDGAGSIVNEGALKAADGGYVALLAPEVRNEGVISARLGTVALATGDELRLDFAGDRLIEVKVDKATVDGLIDNKNLIQAEGGWVLMSTDAASRLSQGAINNTGIVRATTVEEHEGVIKLLGGVATVAGTLDASAPNGGNGGFIETSGHTVNIDPAVKITTLATQGTSGNWLIDPNDFTVAATGGNITGATLATQLASGNVEIRTAVMGTAGGNGDIFINDAITWFAPSTLRLLAERNITINSNISGVNGIAWFSSGNLTGSPTSQISIKSALSAATVSIGVASAAGTVSQTSAGIITTDALQIRGNANVAFDTAANNVKTLAGAVNGTFSLNNGATSLVVNAQTFLQNSSALNGLVATGNITLQTTGNLTTTTAGNIGTSGTLIDLSAANMVFGSGVGASNSGGLIRLTATGDITGPTFATAVGGTGTGNNAVIRAGGNVDFSKGSFQVDTLAANLTGAGKFIHYRPNGNSTVGTVDGLSGITTNNGNVTIDMESGDLTVANNINAGTGRINLLAWKVDNQGITINSGVAVTSTLAAANTTSPTCISTYAVCVASGRLNILGNISAINQDVNLSAGLQAGTERNIVLGADDVNSASNSGGVMGLTQAELANISSKRLAISNRPGSGTTANITVSGSIGPASVTDLVFAAANNIAVNAFVWVSGTLALLAGSAGTITQAASAGITANSVAVISGASATLNNSTNAVSNLAGNVSGDFSFLAGSGAMTISSFSFATGVGAAGIQSTNNGVVKIQSSGDITVANNIDVGTGAVWLRTGSSSLITINNGVTLTSTKAAANLLENNSCGNVAAFCFYAGRMDIQGTINAINQTVQISTQDPVRAITLGTDDVAGPSTTGGTLGLTSSELNRINAKLIVIDNAGNALAAGATAANVTVSSNVISSKNLVVSTKGNLAINAPITVNSLVVSLEGTASSLTQSSSGTLSTTDLLVWGGTGTSVNATNAANTISNVAADIAGTFQLTNSSALLTINAQTFPTGDVINGIKASNGKIDIRTSGQLNINAPINTTYSTFIRSYPQLYISAGTDMLVNSAINVTGNYPVISMVASNDVTFASSANLTMTDIGITPPNGASPVYGSDDPGLYIDAGRTVTIKSNITALSGLNVAANNARNNASIVNVNRLAGSAHIGISSASKINVTNGDASFTIGEGTGLTNNTAGILVMNGQVNAGAVTYTANDTVIRGNTLASVGNIVVKPTIATTSVAIANAAPSWLDSGEGLPTSDFARQFYSNLVLQPSAIASLKATGSNSEIHIGSTSAPLTIDAGLNSSQVGGSLYFEGSGIQVNAALDLDANVPRLGFVAAGSGLTLNSSVAVANQASIIVSGGGQVTQTASGSLSAKQFKVRGTGSVNLMGNNNNLLDVAANVTGAFALKSNTPLNVTSFNSASGNINGISAERIQLYTSGSLTLNGVLTATASTDLPYSPGTVTDLCTNPNVCKLPLIDIRTMAAFDNKVGFDAISMPQAGTTTPASPKFWTLKAQKPSTTKLNGLVPGVVSYDAASYTGDVLVSASRVFYAFNDQVVAAPVVAPVVVAVETQVVAEVSQPVSQPEATTQVTIVPDTGLGNGGASMENFPTQTTTKTETQKTEVAVVASAATNTENVEPAPPPKLIVEASKSVPKSAGVLNRAELEEVNQQVRKAREKLFEGALAELDKNPKAADLAECAQGSSELCIAKPLVTTQADGYLPIVKRKVALLIGNNAYRSPIPSLETAVNDVTEIGQTLKNSLGYEVKVVQDAGQQDIVNALNDLIRNTDKDDSVLVMYAGHGYLQEKNNTGYWIPSDAAATNPDKWISNDTIARALSYIPAKQVMLVSDSCYSGTLTKEGKVINTVAVNRDSTLTRRSVLAMSSGADEPVSDEGRDNHSIFAWNMIQMLKQMKTETSGQQMHANLKEAVTKEFPQTPQYGTVLSAGHADGGEYLFTPATAGDRK